MLRRRATSTIAGARSVEITRPLSPTSAATSKPVSPGPAASSRIVSPGRGSSSLINHSRTGVEVASISAPALPPGAIASHVSRWHA